MDAIFNVIETFQECFIPLILCHETHYWFCRSIEKNNLPGKHGYLIARISIWVDLIHFNFFVVLALYICPVESCDHSLLGKLSTTPTIL